MIKNLLNILTIILSLLIIGCIPAPVTEDAEDEKKEEINFEDTEQDRGRDNSQDNRNRREIPPPPPIPQGTLFKNAQNVLNSRCLNCHSKSGSLGWGVDKNSNESDWISKTPTALIIEGNINASKLTHRLIHFPQSSAKTNMPLSANASTFSKQEYLSIANWVSSLKAGNRNCGNTAHSQTQRRIRYKSMIVPYGSTCESENQTRTCINGSFTAFSGNFQYSSCSIQPAINCGNIQHGQNQTRRRYRNASVVAPARCQSEVQTRSCNNGTFSQYSGSFSFNSCTVTAAPVVYSDCGAIKHGQSETRVRYKTPTAVGGNCQQETQTRMCNDGSFTSFSGSFEYSTCMMTADSRCDDMKTILADSKNRCTNCHNTTPDIIGGGLDLLSPDAHNRLVDIESANPNCAGEKLIDSNNPDNSLLLKLVDKTRYDSSSKCLQMMPFGSQGVHGDDVKCFEKWTNDLIAEHTRSGDRNIASEDKAEPIDAYAGVVKVKNLVYGAPVTNTDLSTIVNGGRIRQSQLKAKVSTWFDQANSQKKISLLMRKLFSLDYIVAESNRQSVFGRGTVRFNNEPNLFRTYGNINQAMERTIMDIINNNRSFKETVSSRRKLVTTATLVAYAFADHANEYRGGNIRIRSRDEFKNFVEANLQESDFNDWRYITFTQASTRDGNIRYSEVDKIRSLKNGDNFALFLPRVGFFNDLAFQFAWPTNNDNVFRVTTNQALISALGSTFTAGDATPHGDLEQLSTDHAGPTTTCFACHRLMDPMRATFDRYYDPNTMRSKPQIKQLKSHFSFRGVNLTLNDMDDLANAMADHDLFATSWVGKVCQYANSTKCDENTPEFKRIVQVFKSSNYNFKTMFVEMMSSPIVYGSNSAEDKDIKSAAVTTISRKEHFCSAINLRIRRIMQRDGLTRADITANNARWDNQRAGDNFDICAINSGANLLFTEDLIARGATELSQTTNPDPFLTVGYGNFCRSFSNEFGNNNRRRKNLFDIHSGTTVEDHLPTILNYFLGLPNNHPRYSIAVNALTEMAQSLRAQGKNEYDVFREIMYTSCMTPDMVGIGL